MVAHDEILDAVNRVIKKTGKNEFSIKDILNEMQKSKSTYAESTIRTHIASRLCVDSPPNHATRYSYFERIERGKYRLKK